MALIQTNSNGIAFINKSLMNFHSCLFLLVLAFTSNHCILFKCVHFKHYKSNDNPSQSCNRQALKLFLNS